MEQWALRPSRVGQEGLGALGEISHSLCGRWTCGQAGMAAPSSEPQWAKAEQTLAALPPRLSVPAASHLLNVLCAHWRHVSRAPRSIPRASPGALRLEVRWPPVSRSAVHCLQLRWPCQKPWSAATSGLSHPFPTCHRTLNQRGSWPLPLVETTKGHRESCSHRRAGRDTTQAKSKDRQQLSKWPLTA